MKHANHIGGEWVAARSGATDEVLAPATGEVITSVPSSDAADIDDAVVAARGAFAEWGSSTPRARAEALLALADRIEANIDELKAIEMANVGKPLSIIDFEFDQPASADVGYAGKAKAFDGVVDGAALGVEYAVFQADVNAHFVAG